MSLGHWIAGKLAFRPSSDEKYDRAIQLVDEVSGTIKDRTARGKDPFTAITLDLLRIAVTDGCDPALVAEAFEIQQESKIFRGPS